MNPAEFNNIARAERDFWWYRGMWRILAAILDPIERGAARGKGVLEVGCGTGYVGKLLVERYGWDIVSLDVDWTGLQFARSYGAGKPIQGNARALPFADGSFDGLISLDAIQHLRPTESNSAFREFRRVLRRGGRVMLRTSAFDWLRSEHSAFIEEKQRFALGGLRSSLEEAGFRVDRATYANCFLLPVSLVKFRMVEPWFGGEATSGVEPVATWLDKLLYLPLAAEARLVSMGLNFPVGQSILIVATKVD